MLINIIIILKTGISYINVSDYTHINWDTIYKFKLKLVKYSLVEAYNKNKVYMFLKETIHPKGFYKNLYYYLFFSGQNIDNNIIIINKIIQQIL
jgi:hypothetical protein